MRTYLLLWNPNRWVWENIDDSIAQIAKTGTYEDTWGCGVNKSICAGDRIFILRLGVAPKGIVGSGYATTNVFQGESFLTKKNGSNKVGIFVDVLLNPESEPILEVEQLKALGEQHWSPQASGISVNPEICDKLEELWFNFLAKKTKRLNSISPHSSSKEYEEGAQQERTCTVYERNPYARKQCIQIYGYSCFVCGFNFEKFYGILGKNIIHVHHLAQLSSIGDTHMVNPMKDLRPVCPNCHAVIHSKHDAFEVEDIRRYISRKA